jgi:hypothetical protein
MSPHHPARLSRLYYVPAVIATFGASLSIMGLILGAPVPQCGIEKCIPQNLALSFGLPILILAAVAYLIVLLVVNSRKNNGPTERRAL